MGADQLNDASSQVRKDSAAELIDLGVSAVPTLRRVLQETESANTRAWACGALQKLAVKYRRGADSAVPNLVSALSDIKSIAVPAAEALLAIGAPAAVDAVSRIETMLSKYP